MIAEVVYDDGEMMWLDGLRAFAADGCPLSRLRTWWLTLKQGPRLPPTVTPGRTPGGVEEER